jgi:hypothetical protein
MEVPDSTTRNCHQFLPTKATFLRRGPRSRGVIAHTLNRPLQHTHRHGMGQETRADAATPDIAAKARGAARKSISPVASIQRSTTSGYPWVRRASGSIQPSIFHLGPSPRRAGFVSSQSEKALLGYSCGIGIALSGELVTNLVQSEEKRLEVLLGSPYEFVANLKRFR